MSLPSFQLTARDFDAYAPEKATSSAFSRPRMDVKERALAWARGVQRRLGELGVPTELQGSDEHPTIRNRKRVDAQSVYFFRDAPARASLHDLLERGRSIAQSIGDPTPWKRHALLVFRVDVEGAEVAFVLHREATVDVESWRSLVTGADGEAVLSVVRALPEGFALRLGDWAEPSLTTPTPESTPTRDVTPELLVSTATALASGAGPLRIGLSIPRGAFVEGREDNAVEQRLEDALVSLVPLYRLVAWSPENDRVAVARKIQDAEAERTRAHAEAETQNALWEARRRPSPPVAPVKPAPARPSPVRQTANRDVGGQRTARVDPGPRVDEATTARPFASVEAGRVAAVSATMSTMTPMSAPVIAAERHASDAPKPASVSSHHVAPFERGAKVRVLAGPFADKTGVIGELDGRGGARVLFGLLSTRVDLAGLERIVEREERPALASSHRRPLSPPPRRAR